jgi:hypothetical protein
VIQMAPPHLPQTGRCGSTAARSDKQLPCTSQLNCSSKVGRDLNRWSEQRKLFSISRFSVVRRRFSGRDGAGASPSPFSTCPAPSLLAPFQRLHGCMGKLINSRDRPSSPSSKPSLSIRQPGGRGGTTPPFHSFLINGLAGLHTWPATAVTYFNVISHFPRDSELHTPIPLSP